MATVKVKEDGKAPSGLSVGTNVVTGGGTYQITGVKEDGSYESKKVSDVNTSNYKGNYDSPGGGNGSTSSGYSGGGSSGGGGGGSSRNTSPTVRNAVNTINTATGITNGYKPIGNYNDAGLRSMGSGAIDPITQYKLSYEEAKAAGDQKGMEDAHAAAEAYRARYGYLGGSDGSQRIASGSTAGAASGNGQMQFGLRPGVDKDGYFDSSTAYYKVLDNGWRIPNTFSQGSLQPGDRGYVDTTKGYGWGDNDTPMIARSADGSPYEIGTTKGRNFVFDSKPGDTLTGGDGSVWRKNKDGTITISKAGTDYTLGAGGASALAPGSGGASALAPGSGGLVGAAMAAVGGTDQQDRKRGQQEQQEGLQARQVPAWQMPEYNYTPFEQTEAGKAAKAEYDALLKRMESYQPFSYNPETDPLYQQYADSYTRSGQRAMSDVLGQLAARTGGMASSYAGTMAQQQYDQYMQELANKVPELRQLAYNMYVDNYNRDLGQYDRTYQRYADDYSRYIDQNRFNYDVFSDAARMDYQANRDAVADSQWAREMALRELQNQQNYGLDLTKLNYDMYSDQRNYDRDVYTNNRNYNRDVLTSDRAYEADRADTQWNQDWAKTQFDYQKEQDARQWELTQRQYADQQKAELRERVDRYGYMPTQQDAEAYGLSAAELLSLQEQARHVRAADASKYYSGW